MSEQTKRRVNRRLSRTRILIPDPTYAWFVTWIGWGSLGIGAFFGGTSWWYHQRLLESLRAAGGSDATSYHEVVSSFSSGSLAITAVAAVGTVLFVTLLALFLMHRISGPIYRLRRHMLDIVMGAPPTPLRFRDGDRLSDLCAAFNEFLRHQGLLEASATVDDASTVTRDDEGTLRAGSPG